MLDPYPANLPHDHQNIQEWEEAVFSVTILVPYDARITSSEISLALCRAFPEISEERIYVEET